MQVFVSAGEPSGDLHGANLIQHLQALRPDIDCVGFGGPRMEEAGCRLHFPLSQLAVMGIIDVLAHIPMFLSLLSKADRWFRHHRPDAVVLIDYPGFHWWLARRAHFHKIPVIWFVPPQLWAWAGWRVRKMQRWVSQVLCNLPFEEEWYRQRGVQAQFVGHPYFDELAHQQLDAAFLAAEKARPGRVIGLLPGSRGMEIERNLTTLLRSAARIHAERPETRFLVAAFKEHHRQIIQERLKEYALPIEVHVGRTPEIIDVSEACVSVSGSVSLELLYRTKPTVIVYRVKPFEQAIGRRVLQCRYITLVNLLADAELYPEFVTVDHPVEPVAQHILKWLADPAAAQALRQQLADLKERVAIPGACARAARCVIEAIEPEAAARAIAAA